MKNRRDNCGVLEEYNVVMLSFDDMLVASNDVLESYYEKCQYRIDRYM